MIPQKKKTPEEIAALRQELGMPSATPETAPPPSITPEESPSPALNAEPIVHLDLPPTPAPPKKAEPKPVHSLRKHDLPLAPAPASTHKTELPAKRHDSRDISQIRKREALAALQQPGIDPAAYLRQQTASPFLFVPGYLLGISAGVTVYESFHYITPAVLLGLSALVMIFIAWQKPRSRHHAALLFIVVFLTLVFGALHYAPLFQNAP
ncbi:MAG: hypothetical protein RLZZ505_2633 [Verrucomicrobiota bacterium]|jgi:hypothetical protein